MNRDKTQETMPPKNASVNKTNSMNGQRNANKDTKEKKIPQWSSKTAEANAKNGKFAKATGGGTLVLSGAPRRWEKDFPNDIYLAGPYRIVGPIDELRNYFNSQGGLWTEARLQEALTNFGITKTNYQTTMSEYYNNEMVRLKQIHELQKESESKKNVNPMNLDDLKSALEAIKGNSTTVRSSRNLSSVAGDGSNRTNTKTRVTDNMETRINNARANQKIVDVSSWDPKDTKYKGVKMIKPPGEKSRKIIVEGLPLASSNLTNYIRAIGELPSNYATYIDLFKQKMDNPCDTPFDVPVSQTMQNNVTATQTVTSQVVPPQPLPIQTLPQSSGSVNLGNLPAAQSRLTSSNKTSPKRHTGGKK